MTVERIIENLEENGSVVVNVRMASGEELSFEMVEDLEDVVALEVVALEDYEENGYEAEGLESYWYEV